MRHFPTKSELLIAAIRSSLDPAQERIAVALDRGDALPAVLRDLANFILDHRSLGVLWQREARSLDDNEQRELRAQVSATSRALAAVILGARPDLDAEGADLLAWCAFGALVSVGFHSLELSRDDYVRLLAGLHRDQRCRADPAPAIAGGHRRSTAGHRHRSAGS